MTRYSDKLWCLIATLAMVLGTGCLGTEPGDGTGAEDGKDDAWNAANDPVRFAQNMEYNWEVLRSEELRQGASKVVPWPDTYWPMTEDGYNDRWNGTLSPVELYDQAFNEWVPEGGVEEFMKLRRFSGARQPYDAAYYEQVGKAASWAHTSGGNYRARQIWNADGTLVESVAQVCDTNGDNRFDSAAPADRCDYNGDERVDSGDELGGLEGWWGHCHAWAPGSFMYREPQHSVTVNGVTFQVADIKALAEATMEGGRSLFLGGRCNTRNVTRDEHGRITDVECRDTNPGALHVVLLNRMGRGELSFVIDATYDYQVWNQPVRDYTITRQEEIPLDQALQLLGRTDVTEYPYNSDAKRFVHVNLTLRYIVEGSASATPYIPRIDSYTRTHNYDYILELDAEGNIIGGEWIDDNPHPDFIWAPMGTNDVRDGWYGPAIIRAADVQRLVDLATATEEPEEPPVSGNDHTFSKEPNLAIPDDDANGVSDTIAIPEDLTIAALRVNVNITHTYRGDLRLELLHNGQTVTVFDRQGGGADDLIQSFPVTGFDGQSARGDWTLRVVDTAGADTGTVNSWSVVVTTAE